MRRLSLLNRALDASVLLSFDRNGFRRHAKRFVASDLDVDLRGRRIAVTGANSGIGKATALGLAERGAEVWMLCRSKERGEAALAEVRSDSGNDDVHLLLVDVSDFESIRAACAELVDAPLHGLVHNAGVLPSERRVTPDGNELTLATNLLGPFLMTWLLLPALRSAGASRLLWVTSGGMYPTRLSMKDFQHEKPPFDGVEAYSRTKRAQVVLTEQLAERLSDSGVIVHAMHPGWADTPAVASSIPAFHKVMKAILRTPMEGADTLLWLATADEPMGSSGQLWFDRRAVATHYLPTTRARDEVRQALWDETCRLVGVDPKAPLP